VARAIFRSADAFGCVIHITVDGSTPTLPPPSRGSGCRVDPPAAPPRDEFGSIFPLVPRGHAYAIGTSAKRTYKADLRHSDKSLYPAGGRA
jgi:hypothetical protein